MEEKTEAEVEEKAGVRVRVKAKGKTRESSLGAKDASLMRQLIVPEILSEYFIDQKIPEMENEQEERGGETFKALDPPISGRPAEPTTECKHQCKQKSRCKHDCCKMGLKRKAKRCQAQARETPQDGARRLLCDTVRVPEHQNGAGRPDSCSSQSSSPETELVLLVTQGTDARQAFTASLLRRPQ